VVALGLVLAAVAPAAGMGAAARATSGATSGATSRAVTDPGPPAPAIPRRQPVTPDVAELAAPLGTTTLVSANRAKTFPAGPSSAPSISDNGRWVAFASSAPDLVANDTNNAQDVFVRDRRNGSTVRLNLPGGVAPPASGRASEPSISGDGSAVAFTYIPPAGGLTVLPCPGPRILLWHRATGATSVASLTADDTLDCNATAPSVSKDGRDVAYVGIVFPSFDPGPGIGQIFVRDTVAGTTTLATPSSAAGAGNQGNASSRNPSLSADGKVVAFESDASNLVAGDANQQTDVFARTLPNGPTELISAGAGAAADGGSFAPAVSANGAAVAFESVAHNLVPGVAPTARNVYVRDRSATTTALVSALANGGPSTLDSGQSAISADGQIVAFASLQPDLVAQGDAILVASAIPPKPAEVYARDLVGGETIRISEARGGGPAGLVNVSPTVGGNGRFVAFASNSPNLVRNDANQFADIFLRELPPVPTIAPNPVDFGARALGEAGPPIAAIVTNSGWSALQVGAVTRTGAAAADFTIAFNGCDKRTLGRGESCPITITFAPGGSGDRVALLQVVHNGLKPPLTTALHGSASKAKVEIKPPVGRPGIVAIVTGSGFPPNTKITLKWSKGITATMPPIVTDAHGAFRVQMLVFRNDVIGPRDLVVAPAGGASFPPFGTSFLVGERTSEPPRFEPGDPAITRPQSLVFR